VAGRHNASSDVTAMKLRFKLDLEHCPNCAGELKMIAAIQDF
jgi:hypothetical protein